MITLTADQAGERALNLMHKFHTTDPTFKEWLAQRHAEIPALNGAQARVDVARYVVWRVVNRPEANSDMLFLLADALREMTVPAQFCCRTTASLKLLADLVAEEAAQRPPACEKVA